MIRRTLLAALLAISFRAGAQTTELIAGGGDGPDGSPAIHAKLEKPFGVDRDPRGNLLVIDFLGHLRAVTSEGKLLTLCGSTQGDGGDGGPADKAQLNTPHSLAVGPGGDVYIADTLNHRVRKIDAATNVITTVAGTTKGYSGDNGLADKAQFNGVYCIAFNPDQSKLVITDLENHRVRVMDVKTRVVTTAAGNGKKGVPEDGKPAVDQPLADPRAAAMDSKGNLYVIERGDHALRVVGPDGILHTLIPGPAKKGAPHTLAGPKHVAIDRNDNVLVADTDNHRIVKWDVKGRKLIPVAGTGKRGSAGLGGPPLQLQLDQPHGVFVDKDGAIFISDSWNGRVIRVTAGGVGLRDPAKKEIAMQLVSAAENSSLDWKAQYAYVEYNVERNAEENRGYTAGIIGFTSRTGDMLDLVKRYEHTTPGNPLEKFLPALEKVNGTPSREGLGESFEQAWKLAAKDEAFRAAQDHERDRVYFDPAVDRAAADGLRELGQFIYYDAVVMHGDGDDRHSFGGIRKAALKAAKPPSLGGDETAYLDAFLDARKVAMKAEQGHQDTSRVDTMQRKFLREGNLSLAPPLVFKVYGDDYRITE